MEMEVSTAQDFSTNSAPVVQVDLFVNTLRELQEEQNLYQQRVSAAQAKRLSVEKTLDSVSSKHAAALEKNNKMLEVQRAAELKTSMAESEAARLERSNAEKKLLISKILDRISTEEKQMEDDLHTFEDSVTQLCNALRTARKFYTVENQTQEICNMQLAQEDASNRIQKAHSDSIRLQQEIQQIKAEYPTIEEEEMETSPDTVLLKRHWREAVGIFQEDLSLGKQQFDNMNQQLKDCQARRERLLAEVKHLEEERDSKKKARKQQEIARQNKATEAAANLIRARHPISPLVTGASASTSLTSSMSGMRTHTFSMPSRSSQPSRQAPTPSPLVSLSSISAQLGKAPATPATTQSGSGPSRFPKTVPRLITFNFKK